MNINNPIAALGTLVSEICICFQKDILLNLNEITNI